MDKERWTEVDRYITERVLPADPALEAALAASDAAGLPAIQVSANMGKLLQLLAQSIGARVILEIGTLGGYSTIWLGRALPQDGRLVTMEIDPKHAEVARANIDRAGLSGQVTVLNGDAHNLLAELERQTEVPFDLTFIDADKASIPFYFESALRMSRRGSLILVDNVVRDGAVIEADSTDPAVQGVRKLNEMMSANGRLTATVIQTVGVKGYDGLAIALVN